jgi:hypothetical protein
MPPRLIEGYSILERLIVELVIIGIERVEIGLRSGFGGYAIFAEPRAPAALPIVVNDLLIIGGWLFGRILNIGIHNIEPNRFHSG